jgi:hypothetical protein
MLPITFTSSAVMIPVLTAGLQGPDGSAWDTDVWLANVTDEPVEMSCDNPFEQG